MNIETVGGDRMLKQPTVRQHYIQRKYLEPWCDETGLLWAMRLDEKKYFHTTPKNVFLRKGYYKLPSLNKNELDFLSDLIVGKESNSATRIKPIESIEDFANTFIFLCDGLQEAQEGRKSIFSHALDMLLCVGSLVKNAENIFAPEVLENTKELHLFENVQMQSIESIYCGVEDTGFSVISELYQRDTLEEEDIDKLMLYCGVQYFRATFAGKVLENLTAPSDKIDIKKIRPICQLIIGLKFADNLRLKTHDIQILTNKTSMNFITGEQPIINILAKKEEETTDLELFYPITPKRALLIKPNANPRVFSETISDLERIKDLNVKIIQNSNTIVGKNKGDIKLMVDCICQK